MEGTQSHRGSSLSSLTPRVQSPFPLRASLHRCNLSLQKPEAKSCLLVCTSSGLNSCSLVQGTNHSFPPGRRTCVPSVEASASDMAKITLLKMSVYRFKRQRDREKPTPPLLIYLLYLLQMGEIAEAGQG